MDSNLEIFCTCYIPLFLILNKNESHMKLNNIKKKIDAIYICQQTMIKKCKCIYQN